MIDFMNSSGAEEHEDPQLIAWAREIAETASVETSPDRAVFFASTRKRREALHFCKTHKDEGYETILSTRAWRELTEAELITDTSGFSLDTRFKLKNTVCERFSWSAKGNVSLFFNPKRPFGTFFNVELPILLENPGVLSINEGPKDNFRHYLEFAQPQTSRSYDL